MRAAAGARCVAARERWRCAADLGTGLEGASGAAAGRRAPRSRRGGRYGPRRRAGCGDATQASSAVRRRRHYRLTPYRHRILTAPPARIMRLVQHHDDESASSSSEDEESSESEEEVEDDAALPERADEAPVAPLAPTGRAPSGKIKLTLSAGSGRCKACGSTAHTAGFQGAVYVDCPDRPCYLCKKASRPLASAARRVACASRALRLAHAALPLLTSGHTSSLLAARPYHRDVPLPPGAGDGRGGRRRRRARGPWGRQRRAAAGGARGGPCCAACSAVRAPDGLARHLRRHQAAQARDRAPASQRRHVALPSSQHPWKRPPL
jgi:hypothetical protein